jgi:SAM-dependent methyltransferase
MSDADVRSTMRDDWNRRAREDANYYVAFGRREQDNTEFLSTASEVLRAIEPELKRLMQGNPRNRRALEIGCGPGRLLRPMSRHFGEIHGVDVSDEMIGLARKNLAGIPHAHVHATSGDGLPQFAGESFDFVYSYAVFQHIPSRDVVFSYLNEIGRVLKPGGIARFQLNGLPETAGRYDTWAGVRVPARDISTFAAEHSLQLLALDGASTQYMWVTWRKKPVSAPQPPPDGTTRIRRITNAHTSEPLAPASGRFASVSIWMEGLRSDADLNHLRVRIGGSYGTPLYLGAPESDGLQQFNVALPAGIASGIQPLEILWMDQPLCPPAKLRVVPPGPCVPRMISISDGIDLLSGIRIVSGIVKVTIEEVRKPEEFRATVDAQPVTGYEIFCTDPLPPRHEINFPLPQGLAPGLRRLELFLGHRRLATVPVEVVPRVGT